MNKEIDNINRNEIGSMKEETYAVRMEAMFNLIENDTIDDMIRLYCYKGYTNLFNIHIKLCLS